METTDRTPDTDVRTLTIPKAAAECGLKERTLRRWVDAGKVASVADPEQPDRRLVRPADVRQAMMVQRLVASVRTADRSDRTTDISNVTDDRTPDSQVRTVSEPTGPTAEDLEAERRLRTEAEAKFGQAMHSLIAEREKTVRLDAERNAAVAAAERNGGEVDFLRQQLTAETERHAEAERELRVLLLNSQQALQDAERRLALPAPTPAPPVPWWKRLRLWEPKEGG